MRSLFTLFILFSSLFIVAQQTTEKTPIRILNADVLEFEENPSRGKIKKLVGHVILAHKQVKMYCDSANIYEDTDNFDAHGSVHIVKGDSLSIKSDSLYYDNAKELAELKGKKVTLYNKEMKVTSTHFYYDLKIKQAYYLNKGIVETEDFTINSLKGYYLEETKNAAFKTDVDLISPDYHIITDTLYYNYGTKTSHFYGPTTLKNDESVIYCEKGYFNEKTKNSKFQQRAWVKTDDLYIKGDTIYYNEKTGVGKAYNNIEWVDSSGSNIIYGDYAEYLLNDEYSKVYNNAIYANVHEGDTMWLSADTLISNQNFDIIYEDTFRVDTSFDEKNVYLDTVSIKDSSKWDTLHYREIKAFYDVKIFKTDLQAVSDSMYFNSRDSIFWLFRDPILWTDSTQMSADTAALKLKNKELHRMYLRSNGFLVNNVHDPELFNQIKGERITGYFEQDSLKKMIAERNAESLYYLQNEDSAFVGVNKAKCARILARFKDNNLNTVTFLSAPDAIFYPMDQITPKEVNFKNFKWEVEYQPQYKDDLLIPSDRYNIYHHVDTIAPPVENQLMPDPSNN